MENKTKTIREVKYNILQYCLIKRLNKNTTNALTKNFSHLGFKSLKEWENIID